MTKKMDFLKWLLQLLRGIGVPKELPSTPYEKVSHVVPIEYATTVPLSSSIRMSQIRQERVSLESVYCESKPRKPTESWKYRRMVKIYLVLGEDRRKDFRQLLKVIGKS